MTDTKRIVVDRVDDVRIFPVDLYDYETDFEDDERANTIPLDKFEWLQRVRSEFHDAQIYLWELYQEAEARQPIWQVEMTLADGSEISFGGPGELPSEVLQLVGATITVNGVELCKTTNGEDE